MPFRPPKVREMDLIRARQIVRALAPLRRLSSDDAEIVARTIAQSFAEGRRQGLYLANAGPEAGSPGERDRLGCNEDFPYRPGGEPIGDRDVSG